MANYSKLTAELLARYAAACEFKQRHDPEAAATHLAAWIAGCGGPGVEVVECSDWTTAARAARDARDARAAWDARAASAARAAWAESAARDARAAWAESAESAARDAWAESAARDARAAWAESAESAASAARDARDASAASAARAARAAWAAWDASYVSAAAIGALDVADANTLKRWRPLLEAFAAGAWLLWVSGRAVHYVPIPKLYLERQRLHREDGPAFTSLDLRLWYIRGVEVTEQIVMSPASQRLDEINNEPNTEVKRIRIERYGWERYLQASKATVIEHVRDEITQTDESLLACGDMRVLVCACPSTARVYSLEVPATCNSVEQAQNYLSGGRARRIIGAT